MILLIDGNNLAHYLYRDLLPGDKMRRVHYHRLVKHLYSYCRGFPGQMTIELCLDRRHSSTPLLLPQHSDLRVYFPDYPKTADDVLIDRFWFHTYNQEPCLLISNDEDIIQSVKSSGGSTLRVFDFVRRVGIHNPVFLTPKEIPPIGIPTAPDGLLLPSSQEITGRLRIVRRDNGKQQPKLAPRQAPAIPEWSVSVSPTVNLPESIYTEQPPLPTSQPQMDETTSLLEPHYRLTIDKWSPQEGLRFLKSAFCSRHQAEHAEFIHDLVAAGSLPELAELLLHTCGSEPHFARRGALMVRVRLALLRANGEPLSLSELAERTGLKPSGLQGRIRQKAGGWIEILAENPSTAVGTAADGSINP